MKKEKRDLKPRIMCFLCRWSLHSKGSLAKAEMKFPTNILPLELACSSRMDVSFIIEALAKGADGVLIACCNPGDCHHARGNYVMEKKFILLTKLLNQLGIERERVDLEWVSVTESEKLVRSARKMARQISKIGPLFFE